ncbi:MAG: chemotaxis protein CheR [Gammaproteobacteria bacterium]|nr:chemotaxis protein CheR [Gammaproteobacteria bacterium]
MNNMLGLPLDEVLLALLSERVAKELGLDFGGAKTEDLRRLLTLAALEQAGTSAMTWLRRLALESWTAEQRRALAAQLTVGETYFFREPEALAYLAAQHLSPLIQRRRGEGARRLRLWSAGCCTGEEAYTLAILAMRMLPDAKDWQLDIIGSDVNADFLARARQGVYGDWSFRQDAASLKAGHFHPAARGRWQLKPEPGRHVRFLWHNLADGDFPDAERGLAGCDLILCRNALMYFTPARAKAALERLLACLAPEGLLLLSAVESGLAEQAGLAGSLIPGGYALGAKASTLARPRPEPQPMAAPPPPAPAAPRIAAPSRAPAPRPAPAAPRLARDWPEARAALERGDWREARERLERHLREDRPSLGREAELTRLLARALAQLHELPAARDCLEHSLSLDRFQPEAYWLLALIDQDLGAPRSAQENLQKLLYLAPDFILAHYLSGLLLQRQGRTAKAAKAFREGLGLLRSQPAESLVPEGDGMSCAQLTALMESQLTATSS